MAVEYKGKHLYDAADADEKRAVGAVWQSRSDGKCLFVMPTGQTSKQFIKKSNKPTTSHAKTRLLYLL